MPTINYIDLFDKFSKSVLPAQRQLVNSIRAHVVECSRSGDFSGLDEYIQFSKTKREKSRQLVVKYYDSIFKETGVRIDSPLREEKYYDDPVRRQLEIAKFLHTKHSMAEIANNFHISNRLARQDLQELSEGIDVLGTTISIEVTHQGRARFYKSTLHSIFLPLSLTEVYALTAYIDKAIPNNNPNKEVLRYLGEKIYSQLSDYAKGIISKSGYTAEEHSVFYRNDESLAKSREGVLMYLFKSGAICSFTYADENGSAITSKGKIRLEDTDFVKLVLEDGTELKRRASEIVISPDSINYK